MIQGLRKWGEFWVPEDEVEKALVRRPASDSQIERVAALCGQKRVVVQAGGNWGYWPRKLAGMFATVYTFEPDPVNFTALCVNTAGMQNVIRMQAALGDERKLSGLVIYPGKSGCTFMKGEGIVPAALIDDLRLPVCDLIYLDIEGMETDALRGAMETIGRCKPVVAFEEKGHTERFGNAAGSAEKLLLARGYKRAAFARNDIVMVPA